MKASAVIFLFSISLFFPLKKTDFATLDQYLSYFKMNATEFDVAVTSILL